MQGQIDTRWTGLLLAMLLLPASGVTPAAQEPPASFSVRNFGALGDGTTMDTAAIQEAIETAAAEGGGTVFFPAGNYLTGSIDLRSHVTLYLDSGATLLGSKSLDDFAVRRPQFRSYTDNYVVRSLISGENLENVAIVGRGCIDGQGAAYNERTYLIRPYNIRLVECRNILIEGITLRDSPMWMQHYLACDNVTIRNVRVFNFVSRNNDGLDIDCCHDVHISDCSFFSDDDALCLPRRSPCHRSPR